MKQNRREFLRTSAFVASGMAAGRSVGTSQKLSPNPTLSGKRLGSIFNNDIGNILDASSGDNITPEEYERAVYAILDLKPGVLAQNVGMPDPVIYRSSVATTWDKYHADVWLMVLRMQKVEHQVSPEALKRSGSALRKLLDMGTDPLTVTIAACRKRGVALVASYRMNAEDFYQYTTLMGDFGRAHPEWKIPGANCLDPAIPGVWVHRMEIFREVAERYDIDGIEFDFRRWFHMVSDPLRNYPVLTRMVRETRQMLDETARKKGRAKLLLGVRVGPSLDTDPGPFVFPGSEYPTQQDSSCKKLGLDVRTWIAEGLVDYVCPSLFLAMLPGMPKTREFVELAKNTEIGIYPTLWALASWMGARVVGEHPVSLDEKDQRALAVYKDELCTTALRMYGDGADGISTFNWYSHLLDAKMPNGKGDGRAGAGGSAVQTYIYRFLKNPAALRKYQEEPWALPPKG